MAAFLLLVRVLPLSVVKEKPGSEVPEHIRKPGHGVTQDSSRGAQLGTLSATWMLKSQPILGGPGGEGRETRILCQDEPSAWKPHSQEAPTDATPSQGKGTVLRGDLARGFVTVGQRLRGHLTPSFRVQSLLCAWHMSALSLPAL